MLTSGRITLILFCLGLVFVWIFEKMLMKSAGQVICMANKFQFDAIALMDDNFQISIMYVMVNVKQYLLRKDLSPEN